MDKTIRIPWDGWEIVRYIDSGSYGSVYEIQRETYGYIDKAAMKVISIPHKPSEIKELLEDGSTMAGIKKRLEEDLKKVLGEYDLMRKMNGTSNVVNCDGVEHVEHEDGIGWDIYIKMELLKPLTDTLPESPKKISENTVIKIAEDLCKALVLCKKHGIIHRDIKPSNIFISENGDYKLGDFGIAKTIEQTKGGTVTGTYRYMAPEVFNNKPYGSTVDIYSLGLVLYWLLNERRLPFLPLPPKDVTTSDNEDAKNRRFGGEALPPPAHGSEWLKAVVLKACAYDPKERFASAQEMLDAINAQSIKSVQGIDKEDEQPESVSTEGDDEDLTAGPETNDDDDDSTIGVDIVLPPPPPPPLWKKILIAGVAAALILAGGLYFFLPKTDTGTVETTAVSSVDRPEKSNASVPSEISWDFDENTGVLTISGTGEMENYFVLNGKNKVRPWDNFAYKIKSINILNGVTSIGGAAFYDCNNVTSVQIADSVTEIGQEAFSGCNSLSYVSLPNGLKYVEQNAFSLTAITEITIPGSVRTLGMGVFSRCKSLRKVEISDGVKELGTICFDNCTALGEIKIPESVEKIGSGAFNDCYNLTIYYAGTQEQWENVHIIAQETTLEDIEVVCLK